MGNSDAWFADKPTKADTIALIYCGNTYSSNFKYSLDLTLVISYES